MLEKIQETADFLREKMHTSPETAIILGTGLGSLVHEITDKYEISLGLVGSEMCIRDSIYIYRTTHMYVIKVLQTKSRTELTCGK